jgi:hypothetical protein
MMKQLLVMFMLLCSTTVFAQDVIVKKDGSTVVCRVVELTTSEIVYKKWSDLNGSNYIMNRSDASAINYQNGKKVNLSEAGTNLYAPGNQNDGVQQLNDKALLQMDAAARYHAPRNYKVASAIVKIQGWVIGAAAIGLGCAYIGKEGHGHYKGMGIGFIAGGAVWTTGSLLLANYLKKKGQSLSSIPITQYNIKLPKGQTLSASVDLINNQTVDQKVLGIGLRYNF